VVGSAVAGFLAEPLGTGNLMWLGSIQLLACAILAARVFRVGELRETGKSAGKRSEAGARAVAGGFEVIRRIPHLRMIALMVFTAVLVSTFVDWLFNAAVEQAIPERPAQAEFFGRVFAAYNLLAFLFQLFFVGWMLRVLGVVGALFALPLGMGGGVAWMMLAPGLWAASAAKGADQTRRYSVDQAAREILYLPSPRSSSARRPFIDVVANRGGDAVVGVMILVLSGTAILTAAPAMIAMGLVIVWLLAVWGSGGLPSGARDAPVRAPRGLGAAVEDSLDSESARQITSTLTRETPAEEVHYALDVLKVITRRSTGRCASWSATGSHDPRPRPDALVAIADPTDVELGAPTWRYPTARPCALLHFLCQVEPRRWLPRLAEWLDSKIGRGGGRDRGHDRLGDSTTPGSGRPAHALVRRRRPGRTTAARLRPGARPTPRRPSAPAPARAAPRRRRPRGREGRARQRRAGRASRAGHADPVPPRGARDPAARPQRTGGVRGERTPAPVRGAPRPAPVRGPETLAARRVRPTRDAGVHRALLEGLSALGVSKHRLYAPSRR
jgi:hypothetical protein